VHLNQSVPHDTLTALYRLADVCMVTSIRDGMNLVFFRRVPRNTLGYLTPSVHVLGLRGVRRLSGQKVRSARSERVRRICRFVPALLPRRQPMVTRPKSSGNNQAIIVHECHRDIDDLTKSIHDALSMSKPERERRHQALFKYGPKEISVSPEGWLSRGFPAGM